MTSDDPSEDLPEDPFAINVPDFAEFAGPHADEIRAFVREWASARFDYSALLRQQSFRELRAGVWALDEERVRATLLRAIATSIYLHMNDAERFSRWVEAQ
jgi:hypothetical protein